MAAVYLLGVGSYEWVGGERDQDHVMKIRNRLGPSAAPRRFQQMIYSGVYTIVAIEILHITTGYPRALYNSLFCFEAREIPPSPCQIIKKTAKFPKLVFMKDNLAPSSELVVDENKIR